MKSNPLLFKTLRLALPFALWLPGNAPAQPTAGTNAPTQAGSMAGGSEGGNQFNSETFRESVDFSFTGGVLVGFLDAVDKQYHIEWSKVADMPHGMGMVFVPAMRLSRESLERILPNQDGPPRGGQGGGGFQFRSAGGGTRVAGEKREPLEALVALYNSLEQAHPELGELSVQGDFAKPSIVVFHSSVANSALPTPHPDFKMKAFALKGIAEGDWEKLQKVVRQELFDMANAQGSRTAAVVGRSFPPSSAKQSPIFDRDQDRAAVVNLHQDAGLLVVVAPETMLEGVESILAAWRNQSPPPAPAAGPK